MGLIQRLTQVMDEAWEDLIYDRATALYTLMEIANIPEKWLPLMKPLLAFTSDLSFDASTAELRRILSLAVPFWNAKPTELAVVDYAIRMITGNRFRVNNFFDFRMQIDHTVIGEELEDFDPHAIDFPSSIFIGINGVMNVYDTLKKTFVCNDHPTVFTKNEYAFLVIETDITDTANQGIYKVDTVKGTRDVILSDDQFTSLHSNILSYKLYDWMDDFVTEVRLVDEAVGTLLGAVVVTPFSVGERVYGLQSGAKAVVTSVAPGEIGVRRVRGRFLPRENIAGDIAGDVELGDVPSIGLLNRELIRFLMSNETVRPFGERVDIAYTSFLDRFHTKGDLDQWDTSTSVDNPEGGYAVVEDPGGFMLSANPNGANWEDQVTLFKVRPQTADVIARLIFMGQDAENYYYVELDYDNKRVGLWKVVATSATQLGSYVSIPYVKIYVADVIRVEAFKDGSGTRIRVKANGDPVLDEHDDPSAFEQGQVGASIDQGTYHLELVEVMTLPVDVDRVGPNP